MKKLPIILISIFIFLFSCTEQSGDEEFNSLHFVLDSRLKLLADDYYELTINRNEWQTFHRVSGIVVNEHNIPIENVKFYWESNLYWYFGDTLGYVVKRALTDDVVYKSYDTIYITGFNGEEVSTSNQASYSNQKGEVNNMIAPVKNMIGDTLILKWWFEKEHFISNRDSIKIVLI